MIKNVDIKPHNVTLTTADYTNLLSLNQTTLFLEPNSSKNVTITLTSPANISGTIYGRLALVVDNNITYNVTFSFIAVAKGRTKVLKEDGTPTENVKVIPIKLSPTIDDIDKRLSSIPKVTDQNGEVEFSLYPGSYAFLSEDVSAQPPIFIITKAYNITNEAKIIIQENDLQKVH